MNIQQSNKIAVKSYLKGSNDNSQSKLLRRNLSDFQGDKQLVRLYDVFRIKLHRNYTQLGVKELIQSKIIQQLDQMNAQSQKNLVMASNPQVSRDANIKEKYKKKGPVLHLSQGDNYHQHFQVKSKTPQEQSNIQLKAFRSQPENKSDLKELKLPKIANRKETIKTLEDDIDQINKILKFKMNQLGKYRAFSARELQLKSGQQQFSQQEKQQKQSQFKVINKKY